MDVAERTGKLSHAIRRQVGAVIVKDNRILSYGYNGMPTGWDNDCEFKEYMSPDAGGWLAPDEIFEKWPLKEEVTKITESGEEYKYNARFKLVTKDEVLHAEMNSLMKVAQGTESSLGATLFTTDAPCIHCAKAIFQAGISEVVYKKVYRTDAGLNFLDKCGVKLTKLVEEDK